MTVELATKDNMEHDPSYDQLKRHVIESTGLAYYADKDRELVSQVGRRMAALKITACSAYLNLLLNDPAGPAELDLLAEGLTIGETFFFRHQEVFDALKLRVLPELIERNQKHRRLRIWSAGCATGAETYSLAILLWRDFGLRIADWEVTVLGTDINRDFLAQGRRAAFTDWAFRSAPDALKHACFVRTGHTWTIREEYRRGVTFQYHNLVQHRMPSLINNLSAFDLILCRNVMIYFEPAIMRRLVGQFRECLLDGGWFVVGSTEPSVELFQEFQTVNVSGAVLYRKAQKSSAPAWAPPRAVDPLVHAPTNGQAAPDSAARLAHGQLKSGAAAGRRGATAEHRHRRHGPAAALLPTLADVGAKLNSGQCEEAAACCRRLKIADPLNPYVHYYEALAAEQQGHSAEGEAALRRAIYLDREFVLAHYHLALALLRKREGEAAQRSFRNVVSLLRRRDACEMFPDADGLTVGALHRLTSMQLEVLNRT